MRLIKYLIIFVLIPINVWAACTGSSPSWTCSTWADLKSCVETGHTTCSGFQDGDTISLDTSATITSTITITDPMRITGGGTCHDRDTTADGCGEVSQPGGTWNVVLTGNGTGQEGFIIQGQAGDRIEIDGFAFTGTLPSNGFGYGVVGSSVSNLTANHIIHDLYFYSFSGYPIGMQRNNHGGLAYKIYLNGGASLLGGFKIHEMSAKGAYGSGDGYGSNSITMQYLLSGPNWGGSDFFFIEDCSFYTSAYPSSQSPIDTSYAGKVVVRYSTFNNGRVSVHGITDAAVLPAQALEIYQNYFDTSRYLDQTIDIRSGTALIHDNYTESSNGWSKGFLYIFDEHADGSCDARGYIGSPSYWDCPNSHDYPWDGTGTSADGKGRYPYFGQPAWTQVDAATFSFGASASAYGGDETADVQPLVLNPIYLWDNTGTTNIYDSSQFVYLDTEYYTCTSGCVETTDYPTGYSPYTYPHPLRSGVPSLSSITVASNGTTVTIVASEALTKGVGYNDADLDIDCSVTGNNIGLTYVSGDGTTTLVYTAASTIQSSATGETCNLDFNGDTDSLENGSGIDLPAIVSQSVNNGSSQGYTFTHSVGPGTVHSIGPGTVNVCAP